MGSADLGELDSDDNEDDDEFRDLFKNVDAKSGGMWVMSAADDGLWVMSRLML